MKTSKRNTKKTYHVFTLLKENSEPSIEGVKYPRSKSLVCLDEIFDEEKGENRVIRYVPGEKSIFLDEQTDQDLHNRKRRPYQLTFINGSMIVDNRQVTLLDFVQKCNFNESKKERMPGTKAWFKEHRPEKTAEKAMSDDIAITNAKSLVYNMEFKKLLSLARILDVDVNRKIELIRFDVSIIAANDPQWFIENHNSPNTKRMHYLYEAIDLDIIKVTSADRTVRWSNGQAIVQAPIGVEPLDAMVDLTFEPDGEAVYEAIVSRIKIPEEENVNGSDVDLTDVDFDQELELSEVKDKFDAKNMKTDLLVDHCVTEGVIYKKGPAHHYFKDVNVGKGRKGVIEYLDDPKHETLRKAIIKALNVKKNA